MGSVELEDVLECQRCGDIMSMPTTLNCFHSYCQPCIELHIHNEASNLQEAASFHNHRGGNPAGIVCELCNVYTRTEDVVCKFVLNKCVDAYNYKMRVKAGGPFTCTQCEGEQAACTKCLHCDKELCSSCVKSHGFTREYKDHKLIDVKELSLEAVLRMPVNCTRHANQKICLHCTECQTPICQVCKAENHDSHQTESVEIAVRKILPEVKQKLENYQRRIRQLNMAISGFDMDTTKCNKNVTAVKNQLLDHKNHMIARIEDDYNALLTHIDEEADNVVSDLKSRKSWVQYELAHQESVVAWVNNITGLFSGACLLMELYTSMLKAVSSQDRKLPQERLQSEHIPVLSFNSSKIFPKTDNSVGKVMVAHTPPQQGSKSDPGSNDWYTGSISTKPRHTPDLHEYRDLTKLEVIRDDELLFPGESEGGGVSPTSAASVPVKNLKAGGKQVSFVKSVITALPEDDEDGLADGRMSRASERLSRASVNLPLVANQGSRGKASFPGRLSVNSHIPQELGWAAGRRSLERSPGRSSTAQDGVKRADMYPTETEKSFRCVISSKFSDLTSVVCKPTGEFRIKNFHNRMCVVEDEIWMPLPDENSVAIYSTAGSLLKEKLPLPATERPQSLHPLNTDHLLIAAENGLFVLYTSSMHISLLLRGNFSDVCVDRTMAVALECKHGKVYVLDFKKKPVQKTSFKIGFTLGNMYRTESKLILCEGVIWISLYSDDPLLKYDLQGHPLGHYGSWGKGAAGNMGSPRVSAIDNRGNVLVTDFANNRLQVLAPEGKWSVLLTHVNHPKDAVVLNGGLLYILTDDHKILMFRAERSVASQ